MSTPRSIVIVYGSATGTAKEVAESISIMATRRLFLPTLLSLNQVPLATFPSQALVLFIVSTTGDGQVPGNMSSFWNFLLKKRLASDSLSGMSFGVMGLGDSSYVQFNAAARRLHIRLEQLGGTALLEVGLGDDQHSLGYFGALDPWLQKAWDIILTRYPLPDGFVIDDSPALENPKYDISIQDENAQDLEEWKRFYVPPQGSYAPERGPMVAELVVNRRLTDIEWTQDVRHLELNLPESHSDIVYNVGDVAWIFPQNTGNIAAFLDTMGYDENELVRLEPRADMVGIKLPATCTILQLFTHYLDIHGTPRRYFFEQLSLFATVEEEKEKLTEMSTSEGADLLNDYCRREKRTYVEIFSDFKSCRPELRYLLNLIPPLLPRGFSISSAYKLHPTTIHLTVAIVDFLTPYKRRREGVCTAWLKTLLPTTSSCTLPVKLYIGSGLLKVPSDPDTKLILIGPGTGIAPMRSILQERDFETKETTNIAANIALYFGSRHEKKDYLYGEEFNIYAEKKLIDLHTAFSRDQAHKLYVQGRLIESKEMVFRWITQENAYCFIAGSAKRMPSECYDTIRDILRSVGKWSKEDADKYLQLMIRQKRYCVESWS